MANETQRLWDLLTNRLTETRAGYLDELAAANIPADIDTLLGRLTAVRAGYLDELDFDLDARLGAPAGASLSADLATIDAVVDAIKAVTDLLPDGGALNDLATILSEVQHATYGLSAIETLVDDLETRLTAVRAGYLDELDFDLDARLGTPAGASLSADIVALDGVADTIKALVDTAEAVGPYTYVDAGGEQTVYEDTVTTRRQIWIEVSNRNMTQTGVFRVYRKIDGTNYDLWSEVPVTVAAGAERAFDYQFVTNQHWKITYEEDADEGVDRAIPYNVVTKVME